MLAVLPNEFDVVFMSVPHERPARNRMARELGVTETAVWDGHVQPILDCQCRKCGMLGLYVEWPPCILDEATKMLERSCPGCSSTDIDVFRVSDYDEKPLDDR